ncbi:hypothetical protein [Ramlibacter albus]|uniref:DUF4230 domain-containing protein n=1 Tax=Ramlibacter albus TaxID=2079448 RepID=A0A923ME54_9BURK|nr:hypothetical protein [Ramlibacter albus]MBC5768693.1 hypothetical protein [Ramlibacter albus]
MRIGLNQQLERDGVKTPARLGTVAAAVVTLIVIGIVAYRSAGRKEQQVATLDPAKIIVIRTPGGMLEVATLQKVEEFGWQAKYECPFIDCSAIMKPTISRVRVPVHYVYRIPLSETWQLQREGDQYTLTVPPLQPTSPVPFDTAKLEIESTRGWISPGKRGNEQGLLRQLGPELDRRAGQDIYLKAVMPHATQTVQEFATKWMREQGKDERLPVKVTIRYTP